jgi:hypothetical protein
MLESRLMSNNRALSARRCKTGVAHSKGLTA